MGLFVATTLPTLSPIRAFSLIVKVEGVITGGDAASNVKSTLKLIDVVYLLSIAITIC